MQSKMKKCSAILLGMSILLFVSMPVYASELSFNVENKDVEVNQQFEVKLELNTHDETINAVEGSVLFPKDFLNVKEIRDGNSFINFWIVRPTRETVDQQQGEILFSGITPGGFTGKTGFLFSIVFEARKEGKGMIDIRTAKVLRHDGEGTETKLTMRGLSIEVRGRRIEDNFVVPPDTDVPEVFDPTRASDPLMFDGKWFLVFTTQDKGSGIDHYEVQESRTGNSRQDRWIRAESPYVLVDQKLQSYIFVRAIDKTGNSRIVSISPHVWRYKNEVLWGILILGIFLAYSIARRKFYGSTKN